MKIQLSEGADFSRLAELWQDLEARADGSFFQSWAWVGCRAPQRFADPLLLQARENGAVVALGLFNRRRRLGRPQLLLNESGLAQLDAVFVEHNGILVARSHGDALIADCLTQALIHRDGSCGLRRAAGSLVLSGVPERYVAAVRDGPQRVRDSRRNAGAVH